jgi:hypothetical protein
VRAWSRIALLRRVIVNLDDGTSIDGVLYRERGPLLVLKNATFHDPAADAPMPLDGDVIVERARIVFVQAP